MKQRVMTPERVSVLVGVVVAMLANLPRYLTAPGQSERAMLLGVALGVVAIVALLSWRLLDASSRQRLPGLFRRLGVALAAGLIAVAVLQWSQGGLQRWLWLSHGTTLGLLGYAILVGWRRRARA